MNKNNRPGENDEKRLEMQAPGANRRLVAGSENEPSRRPRRKQRKAHPEKEEKQTLRRRKRAKESRIPKLLAIFVRMPALLPHTASRRRRGSTRRGKSNPPDDMSGQGNIPGKATFSGWEMFPDKATFPGKEAFPAKDGISGPPRPTDK